MATSADFYCRFPEFCDVPEGRAQLFLDDAALLMADPERWLVFYDVAHAYFAAHMLVVAMNTEAGDFNSLAPIKRQEVDDVIIQNAIGDMPYTADELNATSYGKRFIYYRRIVFVGIYGV